MEVSDGYFRAMGVPLRDGRPFGPDDGMSRELRLVVSERLARHYWPRGGAVGASVRMGPEPDAPRATVVGVVGDVRHDPAQPVPEPILYMSVRQAPWNGPVFLVRTGVPAGAGRATRGSGSTPEALVPSVRAALAALDPRLPLHDPRTLRTRLDAGLAGRRLPVVLITAFGTLALLLASVGVYAMFSAMAAAREREFGVRVTLGASRRGIAGLVLRQGGVWMAAGLAGGAVGIALVARTLRNLLYGVPPFDPVALGLAVAALLACAAVALLIPVRRATRVDPITTLR